MVIKCLDGKILYVSENCLSELRYESVRLYVI